MNNNFQIKDNLALLCLYENLETGQIIVNNLLLIIIQLKHYQ